MWGKGYIKTGRNNQEAAEEVQGGRTDSVLVIQMERNRQPCEMLVWRRKVLQDMLTKMEGNREERKAQETSALSPGN